MFIQKKLFSSKTKHTVESICKKAQKLDMKTITMGFPDIYGRFLGKKYDPDYFLGEKVITKGSNACNYLLGCDMNFTPLPTTELSSFELGYGDFMMKADIDTCRDVDYINDKTQFLFFSDLVYLEDQEKYVEFAPRMLLKRALEGLQKHGIKLEVECEINFTAFYEKYRKAMNHLKKMQPITEHNNLANVFYSTSNEKLLSKLIKSMKLSHIPVNSIYGDSGKGQFKVCLDSSDPVTFSDNIVLMKLITKKIADDNDMSFTYMAKFHKDEPGNGLNLKLRFTDLDGNDLSAEKTDMIGAGILKNTLDFACLYGPNNNSYKRFLEEEVLQSWNKMGNNSNIQGVNLVEENKQKKIHFNLPGSDSNPYLVLFSAIKSAENGLKEKISSSQAEKLLSDKRLPISLYQSIKSFRDSNIVKESLGRDFHFHYTEFFKFEYQQYMDQVSLWENERYLYSI